MTDSSKPDAALMMNNKVLRAAVQKCLEAFKFMPVCVHCGEPGTRLFSTEGDGDFWLCDSTNDDHSEKYYCGELREQPVTAARAEAEAALAFPTDDRLKAVVTTLEAFERWPTVLVFAMAMIRKLDHHKAKKGGREGWEDNDPRDLLQRVREETDELEGALFGLQSCETGPQELLDEAADVANMAMMVADSAGTLEVP